MHADSTKYCVYVLWLSGFSTPSIACWTGLSEGQVRGLVGRSPWHDRQHIALNERQRLLDDYRAVRLGEDGAAIDGGLLDGIDWVSRHGDAAHGAPIELVQTASAA